MMPNRDELIAEYTQCQTERARSATTIWQSTSVFIAILALTAIMMGAVLTSESLPWQLGAPITWGFWLGTIVGSLFWALNVREEKFAQRMAQLRMIEIEAALGFRHQLYITLLREEWSNHRDSRYWALLRPEEKTYLESGFAGRLFTGKDIFGDRAARAPRVAVGGGSALAALAAMVAFTVTAIAITVWLATRGDVEAVSPLLPPLC